MDRGSYQSTVHESLTLSFHKPQKAKGHFHRILASGHLKGRMIFSWGCLSLTEEGNKRLAFIKRQLSLRVSAFTKSSYYP